jgi:hypothetical protein
MTLLKTPINRLFFCLALLIAPVLSQAQPYQPPHLVLAQQILNGVSAANTSYRHRGFMRIAGEGFTSQPEIHTDCSGLISGLLERTYPEVYKQIAQKTMWRGTHPQATSYVEAIQQEIGFNRITQINELRAGDIIAMRYPPGSQNTGHIVLVEQPPQPLEARPPMVENTLQWQVAIIDSTSIPHGQGDSRIASDTNSAYTGMGRGYLRLYTGLSGDIVGYAWHLERQAKYYDSTTRPLAIGRIAAASSGSASGSTKTALP